MNTHKKSTGKHRWIIVAPLFALMFAFTVREAVTPALTADVLNHSAYHLEDGSQFNDATKTLAQGTVLVAGDDLVFLNVADMTLEGWNGGFLVTKNGESITIVALSTPVLIRQGENEMIVPAFMQWKSTKLTSLKDGLESWIASRDVKPLPEEFKRDQLQKIAVLEVVSDYSHDPHQLFQFLTAFTATPDHALLAAFHPLVADHARVFPLNSPSDDERLSLLLLTPLSDTTANSLSPISVEQWKAEWMETLKTQKGILQFAAALPILKQHIERLDALHYPKRVDTYVTALLSIADSVQLQLLPQAKQVLTELRTLRDARRLAAPIADTPSSIASIASASSVSSTSVVSIVSKEQAEAILQNAGFMITNDTQLIPVGDGVQVSNIIFGTASGDMPLGFVLHPATSTVSAISFEGQMLPNSVTMEQLTQWLSSK
jgi:hypothetical protein